MKLSTRWHDDPLASVDNFSLVPTGCEQIAARDQGIQEFSTVHRAYYYDY